MPMINERMFLNEKHFKFLVLAINFFTFLFQGGGGLVYQLRKSYSLTDLGNQDEFDDGSNPMNGSDRFQQLPRITDITGEPPNSPDLLYVPRIDRDLSIYQDLLFH